MVDHGLLVAMFVRPTGTATLQRLSERLEPDLLVVSGDLTQRARHGQFDAARRTLGGHIHLPYVLPLTPEPHPTWIVQAGTAVSDRVRHDAPDSARRRKSSSNRGLRPRFGCAPFDRHRPGRHSRARPCSSARNHGAVGPRSVPRLAALLPARNTGSAAFPPNMRQSHGFWCLRHDA